MSKKRSIKSFLAPEEAVCPVKLPMVMSLSGEVALRVRLTLGLKNKWSKSIQQNQINPFLHSTHSSSFFVNLEPTLPMMQHSHWATSLDAMYQIIIRCKTGSYPWICVTVGDFSPGLIQLITAENTMLSHQKTFLFNSWHLAFAPKQRPSGHFVCEPMRDFSKKWQ